MKNTKHPGRLVAKLRDVIRKSQSQFAAMLGVSKDTIISVENGRNGFTSKLAQRIYIATGANLLRGRVYFVHIPGENYHFEDFEKWRSSYYPGTDETAKHQFDRIKFWIELLFKAAAKPGLAGNRDRLPALHFSLVEWMEDARKEFKLESEVDEILEAETRYVGHERIPIWQIKHKDDELDEKYLRKLATRLGISYGPFRREFNKKGDRDVIVIEDEFKKDWATLFNMLDPLEDQEYFMTPCSVRKYTSKPKYWFGKDDAFGNPIT